MKNDFRDFYDEAYIMHKAYENSTEEELMHGEWLNKFRKYIDKIKTASGKWRYIYPEDLKEKAKDKVKSIKRDADYTYRNLRSKITGENRMFKASNPYSGYTATRDNKKINKKNAEHAIANEKVQRKARKKLKIANDRRLKEFTSTMSSKSQADESRKIKNVNTKTNVSERQKQKDRFNKFNQSTKKRMNPVEKNNLINARKKESSKISWQLTGENNYKMNRKKVDGKKGYWYSSLGPSSSKLGYKDHSDYRNDSWNGRREANKEYRRKKKHKVHEKRLSRG